MTSQATVFSGSEIPGDGTSEDVARAFTELWTLLDWKRQGCENGFWQLLDLLNQGRNSLKGMGGAFDNLQETWPQLEQKQDVRMMG